VTEGNWGGEDQGACLANPVLHLDELVWGENSRAELREKFFDPQVECLPFDPFLLEVVNHDSCDGNTGLLVLDGLFCDVAVCPPSVVTE